MTDFYNGSEELEEAQGKLSVMQDETELKSLKFADVTVGYKDTGANTITIKNVGDGELAKLSVAFDVNDAFTVSSLDVAKLKAYKKIFVKKGLSKKAKVADIYL